MYVNPDVVIREFGNLATRTVFLTNAQKTL